MSYLKGIYKLLPIYFCLILNLIVLAGWSLDSQFILNFFAGNKGMKFNTSLFFLVISLIKIGHNFFTKYSLVKVLIICIIALGSFYTIIQYKFEFTYDIDNLILKDIYTKNAGRMSLGAAFGFLILTIGIFIRSLENKKLLIVAQHIFTLIIFISTTSIITHILGIASDSKTLFFDTMSLQTSFCFLVLSGVSYLRNKTVGVFSVFFTRYHVSKMLKSIIPVIFIIPIILSFLLLNSINKDIVKVDFGIVIYTTTLVTISYLTIAFIAKNLITVEENREELNSALIKTNHELQETNKRLSEKNKELEQIVYITSHDLQEPLRTVSTISGMFVKKYANNFDEKGKKYITYLEEGVSRMQSLVKSLMDHSRLNKEFTRVPINLNKLIPKVEEDFFFKIKESKTKIIYDSLPKIKGNKNFIRQLFQNLISNSIKYSKKDTSPIIHITYTEDEKYWQFSVSDNGIGIEEKYTNEVFKIFKRLHTLDKYPGLGIGLAHCKKIIEVHKGEIWVTSEVNKGTTFHFTIQKF